LKLILLVFLSLFISEYSHAQVWGNPGATWHYEYDAFFLLGTIKVTYEGDTVVQNQLCQKLVEERREITEQQNGVLISSPTYYNTEVTRFSGDSVFWWKDNQFFLLYDFGAGIGDTWVIYEGTGPDSLCDSSSVAEVTATGIVTVSGEQLRFLDLEMQGNPAMAIEGRAYEKIGMATGLDANYIFPLDRVCDTNSIVDYFFWDLICYENDSFPLYNPGPHSCDYYAAVGLEELNSSEKKKVEFFDLLGKEVQNPRNEMIIILYSDGSTEKRFVD